MNNNHLRVVLNGTNENPFAQTGLKFNPFPQIASYETTSSCLRLQELAGEPIPNVEYIRTHLKGYFTDEFIDLLCSKFEPGKMVKFIVHWPADKV